MRVISIRFVSAIVFLLHVYLCLPRKVCICSWVKTRDANWAFISLRREDTDVFNFLSLYLESRLPNKCISFLCKSFYKSFFLVLKLCIMPTDYWFFFGWNFIYNTYDLILLLNNVEGCLFYSRILFEKYSNFIFLLSQSAL